MLAAPIGPASGARSRQRPHRLEQRQTATRTAAAGVETRAKTIGRGRARGGGCARDRRHLLTPENGRRCGAEPLMRRPCSTLLAPHLAHPPPHLLSARLGPGQTAPRPTSLTREAEDEEGARKKQQQQHHKRLHSSPATLLPHPRRRAAHYSGRPMSSPSRHATLESSTPAVALNCPSLSFTFYAVAAAAAVSFRVDMSAPFVVVHTPVDVPAGSRSVCGGCASRRCPPPTVPYVLFLYFLFIIIFWCTPTVHKKLL